MIRYVFDMERGQLRPVKENDSQTLPASWEVLLMDEKEFSDLSGDYPQPENVKKKPLTCPVL